MSLITRCPTCETMFRVVPDQLRLSEGWVRCGNCAEVFDATQNMVPMPGADDEATAPRPAPQPTPPAPVAQPSSTPPIAPTAPTTPVPAATSVDAPDIALDEPESEPATQDDDDALLAAAVAARIEDWPDAPQTDPQTVILESDDASDTADTLPPSEDTLPPTDEAALPRPMQPAREYHPEAEPVAAPSFLRGSDANDSIWQRPMVRIALAVVVLVLIALLAVQFLIKERDRVAAYQPALRPALQALCAVSGCSISPLHQIESIVIDSSSFSRVRGDDYRLGFSLKNTAPIDVAMPAIELSLTDPQDQAVVRRVILPTEFGAGGASLASASVWTGSLALNVLPGSSSERIAGYRLLAFYP